MLNVLLNLISWLVSLIIGLGLIRAALAILDGRKPEVGDLLSTDRLLPYVIASILFTIATVVGFVLCIVPGFVVIYLFWFFGYAIVDSPEQPGAPATDPVAALRTSYSITSANVGSLLLLAISCIALNLLGTLLCLVGLLVSIPVTALAAAYAWRVLTGGLVASQG